MARSMMLTLARILALPILALFVLPAGAGEMMHESMMVDSTTVTVERASAVWGTMDMMNPTMESARRPLMAWR